MKFLCALFALAMLLGGCSTSSSESLNHKLSGINISLEKPERLPDKLSFQLRNELKEQLPTRDGAHPLSLSIKYSTEKQALQTQQDATYNRVRSSLTLSYVLSDDAGKQKATGKVTAYDSFSLSTSTYSDFVSEQETYHRLAQSAVSKLRMNLLQDLQRLETNP